MKSNEFLVTLLTNKTLITPKIIKGVIIVGNIFLFATFFFSFKSIQSSWVTKYLKNGQGPV